MNQLPERLFHYTTKETLNHIFKENGQVELRMTDYHYLNDGDEGKFLYKYLEYKKNDFESLFHTQEEKEIFSIFLKYQKQIAEKEDSLFVMSFSAWRDSTQFWLQDYAKNDGVCLVIDPQKYYKNQQKKYWTIPSFHKVSYISKNDDIKQNFADFIDYVRDWAKKYKDNQYGKEIGALLVTDIPKRLDVKCSVWQAEQEWRLEHIKIDYPKKPLGVYKKEQGKPRFKFEIDNPFTEIILGPNFKELDIPTITDLLKERGFLDIKVSITDAIIQQT